MKRSVYTGEKSAVYRAVEDLVNRFQYPDVDTVAGPAPDVEGSGLGSEMSVTVAASDASDLEIERADFLCDGTADDVEIMAARDTVGEGRVKLSSGTFFVTPNTISFPGDIWLQGTGPLSTVIRPGSVVNNSYLVSFQGASEGKISDLTLLGTGGGTGATGVRCEGSEVWIRDIWVQNLSQAVTVAQDRVRIQGMRGFMTTFDVFVENSGYQDVTVTECYVWGGLQFNNCVDVVVIDNLVNAAIKGTDARSWVVSSNVWPTGPFFSTATIELSQNNTGTTMDPGCVIIGNKGGEMSSDFIHCDGVERLTVVGNTCTFGAIWLQNIEGAVVAGNSVFQGFGDDGGAGTVAAFQFDSCVDCAVTGNNADDWFTGGFYFDLCDRMLVTGNRARTTEALVDDFWDCFFLDGDRNLLEANMAGSLDGASRAQYGFNIAGLCNMVVGNDFGDPADYSQDALLDAGTSTQLVYPNDATYGDNFTACTSPGSP